MVVGMCVADLPVAMMPLWQLAQLLATPAWSNVAGIHAVVTWQSPHSRVVGM